jgi:2,3-bisphosphoglycerate-independent phosphoglycerate mutase
MYRGVARTVGMEVIPVDDDIEEEFRALADVFGSYDFFFVHLKKADSLGEDGNYEDKVSFIEKVDKHIPMIEELKPDVLMITGDHSTPSQLKSHSWHPVPFMLHSKWCRCGFVEAFGERELRKGELGTMSATSAMPLALAHAGRLVKFGA